MRPFRKVVIVVGAVVATLVALVAILAVIPLFVGGRITSALEARVNSAIVARVAWRDLGLSLLRGFPNVSMTVTGLSVAGVGTFSGDTLLATRQARLVLDLGSVIEYLRRGQTIVVRELSFDQPTLRLRRLADGAANWNITKPSAPSRGPSQMVNISLRRLGIDGGGVMLDDRQSNLSASVKGLNESLSGDFSKENFVLSTRTHADSVSATFGGIPYMHRVSLDLDANVRADMRARRFSLARDTLRLNKLVLALSGTVMTGKPDVGLDVTFSTPRTAFAEILSLVPAIYARDFDRLQTSGAMTVTGQVHGSYGRKAFPALAIRARVDNGTFRYPDLPLGARDIALELAVDNPGGHVDSTVIDVKRFHAVFGRRPIDARLLVRTPVNDPDATLRLAGSIDLADIARTVKLQGVSALSGVVVADLSTHARVSDVDARRYDRVTAGGSLAASRISVRSSTIPHPIAVDTAALAFTPQAARLTALTARIGGSDVRATGTLDNVMGFVLRGQDLRGRAAVSSEHFALDEWKSNNKTTQVIPVPRHVDFELDATAARVTYGALTLANVKGTLQVKNQRVAMRNLSMDMLQGTVVANGFYETLKPDKPAFQVDIGLTKLDIPTAFTSLAMVQHLTPIAKYAQGHVSGALSLAGPIGGDMSPMLTALAGKGDIITDGLVLRGAPVMQKVAGAFSLTQLASPALGAVHASIDIADGRLHVKPFTVGTGGINFTASGSNGIDESLSYDLALAVPRSLLGPAATSTITKLASKADQLGARLPAGDAVQLRAKVTGTVTNPNVSTSFAGMATSMTEAARSTALEIASSATETAKRRADSAAAAAQAKARAEADRLVAAAEQQADSIRAAGKALADKLRHDADVRIDSLVAKATNPIARLAAQKAADQLRAQASEQADRVIQSANARADSLVAQAKQKAPPE